MRRRRTYLCAAKNAVKIQLVCGEESNKQNSRREKKGKTKEESPSLAVAGGFFRKFD